MVNGGQRGKLYHSAISKRIVKIDITLNHLRTVLQDVIEKVTQTNKIDF